MTVRRKKIPAYVFAGAVMLLALGLSWMLSQSPQKISQAAGSQLFNNSGQDRVNLDDHVANIAQIPRRTTIYAYAKKGETIAFGSSAVGIGRGDILYSGPNGSSGKCSDQSGKGRIADLTQERVGPHPEKGGFQPCQIKIDTPQQAGIWKLSFNSPKEEGGNIAAFQAGNQPWVQKDDTASIYAWNVTVFNDRSEEIPGRAYFKYLAMSVSSFESPMNMDFYVLTKEGFQYQVDTNGIRPYGFIFFSNNKGFQDKDGNPLYKSVNFVGQNLDNALPDGVFMQSPDQKDSPTDFTHKIFFERPDPGLPQSAPSQDGNEWLLTPPAPTLAPSDFSIQSDAGANGEIAINQGGNFRFKSSMPLNFKLIIDTNRDGKFDDQDRILSGNGDTGENTVKWDLKDAQGKTVALTDQPYQAQLQLHYGEVHFPFLDVENMDNGFKIHRLTPAGGETWKVYFDDTEIQTDKPLPDLLKSGSQGQDSQNGAHKYANYFGDIKGIDTWAYLDSDAVNTSFLVKGVDVGVTASHEPKEFNLGETGSFQFEVKNYGPYAVQGATLATQLTGLENVKFSCNTLAGSGQCAITPNSSNLQINLDAGSKLLVRAEGQVSGAAGTKANGRVAIISPASLPDTNPDNDSASDDASIFQPNRPPLAVEDLAYTQTDTAQTIDVLQNDSDSDGNLNPASLNITRQPENGTAQVADNKVQYQPRPGFAGQDNLEYQICDSLNLCASAPVKIEVTQTYRTPQAVDDQIETDENQSVSLDPLQNDQLNQIHTPLSWQIMAPVAHGTYQIQDRSLVYTPNQHYAGPDQLQYRVCDASQNCSEASIRVTVKPVNHPPEAQEDKFNTLAGETKLMPVLNNDSDPDGNLKPDSLEIVRVPEHGSAVLDGSQISYAPASAFVGQDNLTYRICDIGRLCAEAKVQIDVLARPAQPAPPINLPPIANDDTALGNKNQSLNIDVTQNDSDPENQLDPASLSLIDPPVHGNALIQNNRFQYIPNPGYVGNDLLRYQVCDRGELCAQAKVTIFIRDSVPIPKAKPDLAQTAINTPVTIDILANDQAELVTPQNLTIVNPPKRGGAVLGVSEKVVYTPQSGFSGTDSFTYQICNLPTQCSSADVTVTVRQPVASVLPRTGGPAVTLMLFASVGGCMILFVYFATRKRFTIQMV